jgi:hypothetical protein
VYLALWSLAFDDAMTAIEPAARLLRDPRVERRFAAAHLLAELGLDAATEALLPALGDDDLRVATRALQGIRYAGAEPKSDLFEQLERVFPRLPKEKALEPIIWPWMALTASQTFVAGLLLTHLGDRPPTRLISYLKVMGPWERRTVAEKLAAQQRWDR